MEDPVWKTQLAEMLLVPPPRFVPDAVKRAVSKGAWRTVIFMTVLTVFFLVFSSAFFPAGFWRDWLMAVGTPLSAPGRVVAHERTSLSINKKPVYQTTFKYQPEGRDDKASAHSYSYVSHRSVGSVVEVEYLPDTPSVARIRGERQSAAGSLALLTLLLPLIPLTILYFNWRTRRRNRFLLRQGELGSMKVDAVEQTNMSVNKQLVYRITLTPQHEVLDARPVVIRKHDPALVRMFEKHQKTGKAIRVLYDPGNPKRMLFPDALRP